MSELRGELSVSESELDSLRERETAYLDELAALKIEIDAKKPATNPTRCFSSTKNNNSSDLISFESAETTLILTTNEEETIMESCVSTLDGGENDDRCSSTILVIQRPLHEATTLCTGEDEDYKKRYFELREGVYF